MQIEKQGMAWAGKVHSTAPIDGADSIQRAEVICGAGGKWSGVVTKDIAPGETIVAFMPDAIVPKLPALAFMEKHGWRVKMMRLRGCPSEVLIVPARNLGIEAVIGADVTRELGVLKHEKEVPANIGGDIIGAFPSRIPKTDEKNFQAVPQIREALVGKRCYAATKYDGTSQTFYHLDGRCGGCSRNNEIKPGPAAVWQIAERFRLQELLPQFGNIALQWECVGPKIQGNPLKLLACEPRLFDAYFIDRKGYASLDDLRRLSAVLGMPMAEHVELDFVAFTGDELRAMAEGVYRESGKTREGIVIRPLEPFYVGWDRASFKVINLNYKDQG